jgi:hypothetical protein
MACRVEMENKNMHNKWVVKILRHAGFHEFRRKEDLYLYADVSSLATSVLEVSSLQWLTSTGGWVAVKQSGSCYYVFFNLFVSSKKSHYSEKLQWWRNGHTRS